MNRQSLRPIISIIILSIFTSSFICAKEHSIWQHDIPFVIKKSGEYTLRENVSYMGSQNAITIVADNVKLDLEGHFIKLTNNNATGILVNNVSEFTITSDAIYNVSLLTQNGIGIHVIGSVKGLIENILTQNNFDGLLIEDSSNIRIKNSQFLDALDAGALVMGAENIHFDACVFNGSGNGLAFKGLNQDCTIIDSDFPDAVFQNLYVQQISGLIVENCSFTNTTTGSSPTKPALVQFGDALLTQTCSDVIMKNCTIVNRPSHAPTLGNTAPEGIGIYNGSGFLVDSCVIDIDNTNQDPAADLSGIHISNPGLGASGTIASNVIIRNCIVQGPATDGIYPDVGTSNVVIEDCLVTGALKDGIFLAGTTACTVKNNTVTNNQTNGIFVGETSVSNAIYGNTVNSNGSNPIVLSLDPMGNGISIASDSSNNIVYSNVVFNNAVNGINDQGTGNQIFNNTAYAHPSGNYVSATDMIITGTPGSPTTTAENISA